MKKKVYILTLVMSFIMATTTTIYAQDVDNHNSVGLSMSVAKTVKHIEKKQKEKEQKARKIKLEKEKARKAKIKAEKAKRAKEIKRQKEKKSWENLGSCRITYYCPACNDPAGSYQSSSGTTLYEGCVACSWLPIGTKLKINGNIYTVMDTCGTDAIDIFVDSGSECHCSGNYYTTVYKKK